MRNLLQLGRIVALLLALVYSAHAADEKADPGIPAGTIVVPDGLKTSDVQQAILLAGTGRGWTVKEKADLCAKFVDGAMEGLAYTYLHPNESIDIHLEMVKEFKGSPTNRDVVKHGQGVMTAMGLVPEVEKNGLGWMDPEVVKRTRETVVTYMGAKDVPPAERLFTNAFAGKVKLTPAEWAAVRTSVARYVPVKS